MDVYDDHANTDEQVVALLIERGNLSAEEIRLLAQPVIEQDDEPIQENPSLEEEEEIIQEPEQALVTQEENVVEESVQALVTQEEEIVEEHVQTPNINEKEVVKSHVVRTEGSQEKEDQNARTVKPLPFPGINTGNLYENILNPLHSTGNLYERVKRAEEELEEEERNKSRNESKKDESEQSLQVHTQFDPIQSMSAESQDNSSNEGSSVDGTKLLKSMTSLFTSHQKNMVTLGSNMLFSRQSKMMSLERQINLDNHREIMETMELFQNQLVEIQGSMRRTDAERLEYAASIVRKFQAKENAKADAEKEQTRITQDEPSRRGDGVSTGTRSKRMSVGDENPRPTKRGGGRSNGGDRGGRSGSGRGGRTSGGDRGVRSGGSKRGGGALPPFQNLLTSEGMSSGGFTYPIDPRVKREEQ
ncbi:keratin, type II cytoskeletal 1-like [Impatiens glandulifera]|uniref:keratin, type II cytoskeletal 1-like n=1 Tax=Impatiens glandulifera TaxID=253017 RepID=UPI001FB17A44|nr:keratin, type II cytoskeletal 1-like [Impatiens glandulifera]